MNWLKMAYCKLLWRVAAIMVMMVAMSSCVHEFPYEPAHDPTVIYVRLHVSVDPTDMEFYRQLPPYSRSEENVMRRFVIEAYYKTPEGEPGQLAYRNTFFQSVENDFDFVATLPLHANDYVIGVWQDIVKDTKNDWFYLVPSVLKVHMPPVEEYKGDTDYKDCHSSTLDANLSVFSGQWNKEVELETMVTRPMAKIVFYATDLEKFVERFPELHMESKPDMEALIQNEKVRQTILDLRTELVYTAYLPTGFNVVTNRPNDSELGYKCKCTTEIMPNGEVRLAFDYVLINTHDTSVNAQLVIRNGQGTIVNTSNPIQVPIHRNGITEIRDEFLTKSAKSGVTIDYVFDGEYNILIPD